MNILKKCKTKHAGRSQTCLKIAGELLTQATFSSPKIYITFQTQDLNRRKYHLSPQPYEQYTYHCSPSKSALAMVTPGAKTNDYLASTFPCGSLCQATLFVKQGALV